MLNFGHTLGHAIESAAGGTLLHGECVALGMLPMCSKAVRERLIPVLKEAGLPCSARFDREKAFAAIRHDKKFRGRTVTLIRVDEPGSFRTEEAGEDGLRKLLDGLEAEA